MTNETYGTGRIVAVHRNIVDEPEHWQLIDTDSKKCLGEIHREAVAHRIVDLLNAAEAGNPHALHGHAAPTPASVPRGGAPSGGQARERRPVAKEGAP